MLGGDGSMGPLFLKTQQDVTHFWLLDSYIVIRHSHPNLPLEFPSDVDHTLQSIFNILCPLGEMPCFDHFLIELPVFSILIIVFNFDYF